MRACRGRIWALLYLSACASSRGARRDIQSLIYFVKQGTPKARSLTLAVVQPASPNMPLIADVRTPTPWQTRPGLSRATPFNAARLDAPLPLSPLPPPRFLPGSRLGSLCDGPSARCRPMKAGSVRRVSSAHMLRSSVKYETPHTFLVLPASSATSSATNVCLGLYTRMCPWRRCTACGI